MWKAVKCGWLEEGRWGKTKEKEKNISLLSAAQRKTQSHSHHVSFLRSRRVRLLMSPRRRCQSDWTPTSVRRITGARHTRAGKGGNSRWVRRNNRKRRCGLKIKNEENGGRGINHNFCNLKVTRARLTDSNRVSKPSNKAPRNPSGWSRNVRELKSTSGDSREKLFLKRSLKSSCK